MYSSLSLLASLKIDKLYAHLLYRCKVWTLTNLRLLAVFCLEYGRTLQNEWRNGPHFLPNTVLCFYLLLWWRLHSMLKTSGSIPPFMKPLVGSHDTLMCVWCTDGMAEHQKGIKEWPLHTHVCTLVLTLEFSKSIWGSMMVQAIEKRSRQIRIVASYQVIML